MRELVVDNGKIQSKPAVRFVSGQCEIEETTDDCAWPHVSSKEWTDIWEYYDYFAGSRQLLSEEGKLEEGPNIIRELLGFHLKPHTIKEMIEMAKEMGRRSSFKGSEESYRGQQAHDQTCPSSSSTNYTTIVGV